jgi:hypothetical protein
MKFILTNRVLLLRSICSLLLFIVVVLLWKTFTMKTDHSLDKSIQQILKNDNKSYLLSSERIGELLQDVDSTEYTMDFFIERNEINQIIHISQAIQKEIMNSSDNIDVTDLKNYIKNETIDKDEAALFDVFINQLTSKKYDSDEKSFALLVIENYFLKEKLFDYFQWKTIPIQGGQVLNLAQKDTVKYGEFYSSKIIFHVKDLKDNIIVFNNGDTIRNGEFKEHALIKGWNKKSGYLQIHRNEGVVSFYKVNVEYYVK